MQIVTICGFIMLLLSVILGINSIVQYVNGTALGGFTTVILLQLFSSSIIMICLELLVTILHRFMMKSKEDLSSSFQKNVSMDVINHILF